MNLEKVISIALYVPMPKGMGLPCLIEGPPGVGKSSRVESAARARGLPFRVVNIPTKQPEDFAGLPVPDGRGGVKWECGVKAVRDLNAEGGGVLLFDELSKGLRAVQASLLSAVLERQIGDVTMHKNIRIFLASNSIEEGDGGHAILTTLGNRLAHLRVEVPDIEEYVAYREGRLTVEHLNVDAAERRVHDAWPRVYAKHVALHCAFLRRRPELLHQQPPEDDPNRGKAWPSPRSWDTAIRAAATCEALGEACAMFDFVRAIVGTGPGDEYEEFVAQSDLPSPEDVLLGKWSPSAGRIDICTGAYAGMVTYALEQPRSDVLEQAWARLREACDLGLVDVAWKQAARLTTSYGAKHRDKAVANAAKQTLARLQRTGILEVRL
ncbi:AAA family ATPase [Pendulispora rubella]|uniref:AAA family ATPase n=1 Tax=Pendulispora rubella TaxID=2741070 RepID=A0ABZ2L0N5_9BACT